MLPQEIKQKLKERNVTMIGIGRTLGISHTAVCLVVQGRSKSARVAAAISEAIDIPVHEIWPENPTKEETA